MNIITNDTFSQTSNIQLQGLNLEINNAAPNQKLAEVKFKTIPSNEEYLEKINTLKQDTNVKLVLPYFERQGSEPIGISDIFYVKLKNIEDTILLKQIADQTNVKIVKQVPCMPLWYILHLQTSVNSNTLDVANFFYETEYFDNIDPAFQFNFESTCTNDPLFNQLWGLNNSANPAIDINACAAWNITLGAGIKVAVVDQGIDVNHNDLSANISYLSFNAQSGTFPSVFISGNNHGTHVAGTIAAIKNNNLQVVGVAPESQIMGVSHPLNSATNTTSAELASGISWAWQNGADVITNSWGDQGGYSYNYLHSAVLENAITNAMIQGRNGKGCVVTFASGNWETIDYPAYFHSDILCVGAINSSGQRSIFNFLQSSGYGTLLDVVAPGSNVYSTLPNNEVGIDDGTSMAAPHVAGVAALILSVRPDLTQAQVRQIIESTAQKVGGYNYQTSSAHPNGSWNEQVGYGLVDAEAAVKSVIPNITGLDNLHQSCGTFTLQNTDRIPSGATVTWSHYPSYLTTNYSTNSAQVCFNPNAVFFCTDAWIKATVSGNGYNYEIKKDFLN